MTITLSFSFFFVFFEIAFCNRMEHFSSAVLSKVSYVDLSVMERPPSLTIVRKVVDVGVVVISSLGGGGGGGGGGDIECVVRFEESRTFFSP